MTDRVLIVEDDAALANVVAVTLKARGYEVKVAGTAGRALQLCGSWEPTAVFLDLGLYDTSGLEVLRGLRRFSQIPVLVVSARHEQEAKINALDEGADDYVTKPFSTGELLARLRAALRRAGPGAATGGAGANGGAEGSEDALREVRTEDGHLVINLPAATVNVDGEPVHLTPRQWGLVSYLASHADMLVKKTDLLHAVWGPDYDTETHYLRVYMSQVRQKLEADPNRPVHFLTEPGMGYRFVR